MDDFVPETVEAEKPKIGFLKKALNFLTGASSPKEATPYVAPVTIDDAPKDLPPAKKIGFLKSAENEAGEIYNALNNSIKYTPIGAPQLAGEIGKKAYEAVVPRETRGKISEFVRKPLLDLKKQVEQEEAEVLGPQPKDYGMRPQAEKLGLLKPSTLPEKASRIAFGIRKGAADTLGSFTSLQSGAELGAAAAFPPYALTLIPGMTKGVYEGGAATAEAIKRGDYPAAAEAGAGTLATAAMLKGLAGHSLKKSGLPEGLKEPVSLSDVTGKLEEQRGSITNKPKKGLLKPKEVKAEPEPKFDDIEKEALKALRTEIEGAQAGYRGATQIESKDQAPGMGGSGTAVGFGSPSTFPVKDTGFGKKEQLKIIDKMLAGEKLTERQRFAADLFRDHVKAQEEQAGPFARDWYKAPEGTTGIPAGSLEVGERIETAHDKYKVTGKEGGFVTIKDGKEFTVPEDHQVPATKYLGKEKPNATQAGEQPESNQPEYIGVSQGADIQPDVGEIRQGKGRQSSGGGGNVGESEIEPTISGGARNVAAEVKQKQRGFAKSVGTSAKATPEVAKAMKEVTYTPITNVETVAQAKAIVDSDPAKAAALAYKTKEHTAEHTAVAMELGSRWMAESRDLEAKGLRFEAELKADEAIDIIRDAAEKATTRGQAIQILSVWDKLGPDGIVRFAAAEKRAAVGKKKIIAEAERMKRTAERKGLLKREIVERPIEEYVKDAEKKLGAAITAQEALKLQKMAIEAEGLKGEAKEKKREEILAYLNEITPSTFMDKLLEFRSAGLLTGPRTHIVNLVSQFATMAYRPIEQTTSAAVELVQSGGGLIRPRERFFGEAPANIFGKVASFPMAVRNGLEAIVKSWKGIPDNTSKRFEMSRTPAIKGTFGKMVRGTYHMLQGVDVMQTTMNNAGALYSVAYRQAMKEGIKNPAALTKRISELVKNPNPEMVAEAERITLEDIFKEPLSKGMQAVNQARMQKDIMGYTGKFIMPFFATPTNVPKWFVRRSPFGWMTPTFLKGLREGGGERADAIARPLLGSAIAMSLTMLAMKKNDDGYPTITGGVPKDKGKAALNYRRKIPPYSVRIGDKYYSYQRLQPLGFHLSTAAAVAEAWENRDVNTFGETASQFGKTLAKSLIDQPFVTGLKDLFDALFEPERYGQNYVQQAAGSFIPTGMGAAAQAIDPTMRKPKTVSDTIMAKIPGLSDMVKPSRNLWGEEIKREGSIWNRIFSPAPSTSIKAADPIDNELARLEYYPKPPEAKIKNVKLDDDLSDRMAEGFGKVLKQQYQAIMDSPDYKDPNTSDEERQKMLQDGYDYIANEDSKSSGQFDWGWRYGTLAAQIDRDIGALKTKEDAEKYWKRLIEKKTITDADSDLNMSIREHIDQRLREKFNPPKKGLLKPSGPLSNVQEVRQTYAQEIEEAAKKYGLDADDLAKQIFAESAGDPNAKSGKGAVGLMQVMPATAKGMGMPLDTPKQQIEAGARYMADMLRIAGGNKAKAYAAYNAGPGAMRSGKANRYKETQNYVNKLTATR